MLYQSNSVCVLSRLLVIDKPLHSLRHLRTYYIRLGKILGKGTSVFRKPNGSSSPSRHVPLLLQFVSEPFTDLSLSNGYSLKPHRAATLTMQNQDYFILSKSSIRSV